MPAFLLVLLYLGVVLVPTTLYLYWAHAAWTWLYLVDPADVPALAVVPVIVVHAALLVAGWYAGAWLLRRDRGRIALYLAGAGLGSLAVLLLLLRERIGSYGSYSEFRAGQAADLLQVKLGYVLMALALALGVGAVYTALELMRDSRRVSAR